MEVTMPEKLTKQDCIELLVCKHTALGGARYPKRDDFTEREVVAIKAHLGPWPRALEAAGIKAPRDDDRAQKILQKRIRAKRAGMPVAAGMMRTAVCFYLSMPAAAAFTSIPQARPSFSMDSTCVQGIFMS